MEKETNSKKGKHAFIFLFLFIVIIALVWFFFFFSKQKNTPSRGGQAQNKNKTQISVSSSPVENPPGEEERLVLNFKDKQVVILGNPLRSKDYVSLFHFVYLGMGDDEEGFIMEETKLDLLESYSYKTSKIKNRLFAAVGKTIGGKPIKQTLEIISQDELKNKFRDCTINTFELNGISAQAITCSGSPSVSCYIPIENSEGIVYEEYNDDQSTTKNLCEALKKNRVSSVTFQGY